MLASILKGTPNLHMLPIIILYSAPHLCGTRSDDAYNIQYIVMMVMGGLWSLEKKK